jgi:glutamine synthetase
MSSAKFEEYITANRISEVECLVADMSGTARGKILPPKKFLKGQRSRGLRIPEEVFTLTINGRYVQDTQAVSDSAIDIYMEPDSDTVRAVPWYTEPTAQVICDVFHLNDDPVEIAPRHVLKRVLQLYKDKGWRPVVAPELEFYLVKRNPDSDYPLEAAVGRSGRKEPGGQAYGIDAANDFDPIVEDIYDYCEAQELDVDTLSHESGPAQLEINFNHGDPLELADQVFLFKRTVRQAALKHDMYATFMAKPYAHPSVGAGQPQWQEHFCRQVWQALEAVPQPHWRFAALPRGGPAALRAERQLLPPPCAGIGCAHQRSLGRRHPHRILARSFLGPVQPAR